jgi:amino acid permease
VNKSYTFSGLLVLGLGAARLDVITLPVSAFLFLIVLTTMFVKQHYFYDAVLALVIFIIMNIIVYSLKLYPKYTNKLKVKYKEEKEKLDNKRKDKKDKKDKNNKKSKKINTN